MFKIIKTDVEMYGEKVDYILDYGRGRRIALMPEDFRKDRYRTGYLICDSGLFPFKNMRREFLAVYTRIRPKTGSPTSAPLKIVGFEENDDILEDED